MPQYIQSVNENKTIAGKIYYSESDRAWNVIRFKKELLDEFTDLCDRKSKFFYEMLLFYRFEQIERFIQKLKKEGKAPPMLFRFGKFKE